MEPRCDDGTLPPNSHLVEWYRYLDDATKRINRPIAFPHNTKEMLHQAGFIEINEQIIRAPLNGWSTDPHQKRIGRWYNIGLSEGIQALSLAPFFRVFQWDPIQHINPLCNEVKSEMSKTKIHVYNNIHIITARKPQWLPSRILISVRTWHKLSQAHKICC